MLKKAVVLKKLKKSSQAYSANLETIKTAGRILQRQRTENKESDKPSILNNTEMMEEDKHNQ